MFLEMIKYFLFVIPAGLVSIYLFGKFIEWCMERMVSSPRLNYQLKRILKEEEKQ